MTVHTSPGVDALTADGGIVRIRPVTSDDEKALTDLYERGSPEGLRMRFFVVPGRHGIAAEVRAGAKERR